MILENLKTAGVQQAHKEDRITLHRAHALARRSGLRRGPLPGRAPKPSDKRAAIFIGPEFGTVQRADLVAAAREPAMPASTC
jgi:adenine-specific DNA-methyltransferase